MALTYKHDVKKHASEPFMLWNFKYKRLKYFGEIYQFETIIFKSVPLRDMYLIAKFIIERINIKYNRTNHSVFIFPSTV